MASKVAIVVEVKIFLVPLLVPSILLLVDFVLHVVVLEHVTPRLAGRPLQIGRP